MKKENQNFYVYKLFNAENALLYVGITKNITRRMNQYFLYGTGHLEQEIYDNVAKVYYHKCNNSNDMKSIERHLVTNEKPLHNKIYANDEGESSLRKDDYSWIEFTELDELKKKAEKRKNKMAFHTRNSIFIDDEVFDTEFYEKYGLEGFLVSWLIYANANKNGVCFLNNSLIKDLLKNNGRDFKKYIEILEEMQGSSDLFKVEKLGRSNYKIQINKTDLSNSVVFDHRSFFMFRNRNFCSRWQLFYLFCVIESRINKEKLYAEITFDRLQEMTGYSRPTISTYISTLKEMGLFKVENNTTNTNGINRYILDREDRDKLFSKEIPF